MTETPLADKTMVLILEMLRHLTDEPGDWFDAVLRRHQKLEAEERADRRLNKQFRQSAFDAINWKQINESRVARANDVLQREVRGQLTQTKLDRLEWLEQNCRQLNARLDEHWNNGYEAGLRAGAMPRVPDEVVAYYKTLKMI